MKKSQGFPVFSRSKLSVSVGIALAAFFASATVFSGPTETATVTLIQSIPSGTNLANPNLPYAAATWVDMIRGARQSIDIEQMYISHTPGQALDAVLRALEEAGARGVKIRAVFSAHMLDSDIPGITRFKAIPGIEFYPLDLKRLTTGIVHAKFWIVDRREVFVGSQNLDWKALTEIHELGVRIQSRNVAERLTAIFEQDIQVVRSGRLPTQAELINAPRTITPGVELVASPASMNPNNVRPSIDALTQMIASARTSIQIQLLDYSVVSFDKKVWTVLDDALRAAARRGVRVQMAVSHWNTTEPGITSLKNLSQVPNIEVRISTVPLDASGVYLPYSRVIHSKYMVVDGAALWLSTSNWSSGYFLNTRNVDFVINMRDQAQEALITFDKVWTAPYTVPVDVNRAYPRPRK